MAWVDRAVLWAEVAARQIYWRSPRLVARRAGSTRHGSRPRTAIEFNRLCDWLQRSIERSDGLCMVHASLDTFELLDGSGRKLPAAMAAFRLVEELMRIMGSKGTLCMPTHPLYAQNPGFMYDKSDLVLSYSVERTPSSVGLLSETFRRTPGVARSAHPLSSLAAHGPLAEMLLHENLNDSRPLPHGRHSGYHRFCESGGVVIGLGVPLIKVLTILHVAEEVLDEDWPVEQFFYERRFLVRQAGGSEKSAIVRERRPEFVRSLALSKVRRDFLRQGILSEGELAGVQTHVADSRRALQWLQEQQRHSTYPYYLPRMARWRPAPRVAAATQQGSAT